MLEPNWREHHHRHHHHHCFTLRIEVISVAIGTLSSPGTAVLLAALLDNGQPFVLPEGSTFKFSPTLSADDTSVTIAVDETTPGQFNVTIPEGDTSKSVTFTAQASDPNGTVITDSLTIPFAAVEQKFTLKLSQVA